MRCALAALLLSAIFQIPSTAQFVPPDPQAQALMEEARDLWERGRVDAARDRWRQVAQSPGAMSLAPTALLRLAETEADLNAALQIADQILTRHRLSPEAAPALALQGRIHWLLGDHPSAARVYRAYLANFPTGPDAPLARHREIRSLIQAGQPSQALAQWERAADADPARRSDPDALMQRADALIDLQRWHDAAQALQDLIARFPNREAMPRAHLAAGLTLERLDQWHDALPLYQTLADRWPNVPEARLARGRILAIQRFDQARAQSPSPSRPAVPIDD